MIYLIVLLLLPFEMAFKGNIILTNLYAISLNANTMTVGIIVALAAFFPMVFAVYAGRVSDRIGYKVPIVLGSFGVSLALILPFIFRDMISILFVSQSIFGLGLIFIIVNGQKLVGEISTSDNRLNNYAIYSTGISIAGLVGPIIAGFSIDYFSYSTTYLFLSLMGSVPAIMIIFKVLKLPEQRLKSTKKESNKTMDLLKLPSLRKVFIISAIILIGSGIYELFLPIYGNTIGLSASLIGIVSSLHASAYFIVRILMPALIKKFGEERTLTYCLFISGITFVFLPFSNNFLVLAILSFILGLGLGCGAPLSIAISYNCAPEGREGEVLGTRLMVNKIVQFFAPLIFGTLGTFISIIPIFWANAIIFLRGGTISRKSCKVEEPSKNTIV